MSTEILHSEHKTPITDACDILVTESHKWTIWQFESSTLDNFIEHFSLLGRIIPTEIIKGSVTKLLFQCNINVQ